MRYTYNGSFFSHKHFPNLGGNYIRENRTALRSFDERKKLVQLEHDNMMEKTRKYLPQKCGISSAAVVYKQFSERLRECLMRHYMTPLSFLDQIRAKKDLATMKSIRRKLKAGKLCLRETDKGGNLYGGNVSYFEDKATEYRRETGAYEELPSSPLEEILVRVTRLLNDLQQNKHIMKKHLDKMMPSRSNVELPYIYYNPKTHKVNNLMLDFCHRLWHTSIRIPSPFDPLRIRSMLQLRKSLDFWID